MPKIQSLKHNAPSVAQSTGECVRHRTRQRDSYFNSLDHWMVVTEHLPRSTMSVLLLVVAACLLTTRARADTFTAVATMADFVLAEEELIVSLELCFDLQARDARDDVNR